MKRSRFTEEQITGILKEQETEAKTLELCRKHGISSPTFYKWKSKYGGLDVSEARRQAGSCGPSAKPIRDERASGLCRDRGGSHHDPLPVGSTR